MMTVQKNKIPQKGVAEQVGELIDRAKEKLSGPGTFEKAGTRVDKAGKRIRKAVTDTFKK